MTILLTALATLAAVLLIAVSATLNYLFMASLARTPDEAIMMGSAAVAGDLIKASLPYFIVLAVRARRGLFVALAVPTFAFLTVVSLIAAVGFAADMRGGTAHGRDATNRTLAAAEARMSALDRQKATLGAARPTGQIDADLGQARLDSRWTSTKACTDVTLPASKTFCAKIHKLQGERATSQAAAELDTEQRSLAATITRLRASGAGQEAEPQVKVLALLTGLEMPVVRTALSLAGALFIELGSGLGLYLALHHGGPLRRAQTTMPITPVATVDTSVEAFAVACILPQRGGLLTPHALHAAYAAWCDSHDTTPSMRAAFESTFAAIAADVGIGRTKAGYIGIGLRAASLCNAQQSPRRLLGAA